MALNEHRDSMNEGTQWATFHLGDELFALLVDDVQEVVMQQPLTPVPLAPEHIVGLLNLRGQVMPAVDLRNRLRLGARPEGASWKLLVLKTGDGPTSVIVDEIGDVLTLPADGWRPPPDTIRADNREAVTGIYAREGRIVVGLSAPALLGDDGAAQSSARGRASS